MIINCKDDILKAFGIDEKDVLKIVMATSIFGDKTKYINFIVCRNNTCIYFYYNYCYINNKKSYYLNRLRADCNPKGPSSIYFFNNSNIVEKIIYRQRNSIHRFNGPAIIQYNYDEKVILEQYCLYGKLHNKVGPAERILIDGKWYNSFYILNVQHSLESFIKKTKLNEVE